MVSLISAIVFLENYIDIHFVFANSPFSMKDQMHNMTGMKNLNMMMDPSQMQKMMMEQMNKTGVIMGSMMGMNQGCL
jgi:hypothetical protein